jgi:hypothetical protein
MEWSAMPHLRLTALLLQLAPSKSLPKSAFVLHIILLSDNITHIVKRTSSLLWSLGK